MSASARVPHVTSLRQRTRRHRRPGLDTIAAAHVSPSERSESRDLHCERGRFACVPTARTRMPRMKRKLPDRSVPADLPLRRNPRKTPLGPGSRGAVGPVLRPRLGAELIRPLPFDRRAESAFPSFSTADGPRVSTEKTVDNPAGRSYSTEEPVERPWTTSTFRRASSRS